MAASTVVTVEPMAVVNAQTTPVIPQFMLRFVNDTLILTITFPDNADALYGYYYRYKESSSENWTIFYPHRYLDSHQHSAIMGEVDVDGFRVDDSVRLHFGSSIDFQIQGVIKVYAGKWITGGEIYNDIVSDWSSIQKVTIPNEPINKPTPKPTTLPLLNVDWSSVDWDRSALIMTIVAVAVLAGVLAVLWRKVSGK